jgi:hypothetical protein
MRAFLVVSALLLSSMASAEEFGGWKFTPPSGATKEASKSVVKLTTIDNAAKTFCQIWIYPARAPSGDDINKEWRESVERPYKIRDASGLVTGKVKDMPVTGRTFTVMDGDNAYAGAFYVLQPRSAISSVMLLSTTSASLAKCPIGPFLESLVLVNAPAPAPQAASSVQGPAQPSGAPAIAGTWSAGSSNYIGGVSQGSINRQYILKPDGTYQYFRETWGGSPNPAWYFTVLETGTWTLDGGQLSLSPKKTVGTEYNTLKKTTTAVKVPLEPATYTAKTVYLSGLQEWNLVLTIAKPTDRDGAFASNAAYPSSYMFNNRNNIKFRYGPK